jgi:hypothetical protein
MTPSGPFVPDVRVMPSVLATKRAALFSMLSLQLERLPLHVSGSSWACAIKGLRSWRLEKEGDVWNAVMICWSRNWFWISECSACMASLTAALSWRHVGHAVFGECTCLVIRRGYALCVRFQQQLR